MSGQNPSESCPAIPLWSAHLFIFMGRNFFLFNILKSPLKTIWCSAGIFGHPQNFFSHPPTPPPPPQKKNCHMNFFFLSIWGWNNPQLAYYWQCFKYMFLMSAMKYWLLTVRDEFLMKTDFLFRHNFATHQDNQTLDQSDKARSAQEWTIGTQQWSQVPGHSLLPVMRREVSVRANNTKATR